MPATAPNNGNGRVTNAILATKLDGLTQDVRDLKQTVTKKFDDHETRIRTVEKKTVEHAVQLKIRTMALAGLNLIMSAGAAFLGRL